MLYVFLFTFLFAATHFHLGAASISHFVDLKLFIGFIHSFIHFILPLTRNTTTVYRNTLKIIYNIPTKLLQDQMW